MNLTNLIGFHHEMEGNPNMITFCCMVAILLLSFFPWHRYFPRQATKAKLNDPDKLKWAFTSLVLLLLTLFFPDHLITGSMTARLMILFYFGVITWLSIQNLPYWIVLVTLGILFSAFIWHRNICLYFYSEDNKAIAQIELAGKHIQPNTIIFPLNCSENWSHLHFDCYLGVDKPLVNIRNPQTAGQMPLIWNYTKMPAFLIGKFNQWDLGTEWAKANNKLEPRPADYVFFWRPQLIQNVGGGPEFLEKAKLYYTEIYRPENNNTLILALKKETN
jgi:hypothetical protein